jgi:hypothetical protein
MTLSFYSLFSFFFFFSFWVQQYSKIENGFQKKIMEIKKLSLEIKLASLIEGK